MKYEWTPASEPPDTERFVLAWLRWGIPRIVRYVRWLGYFDERGTIQTAVVAWTDVEPPTEGKG